MGLFLLPDSQKLVVQMVAQTWIILHKGAPGKPDSTRLERTVALNLDPWYNLTLEQVDR